MKTILFASNDDRTQRSCQRILEDEGWRVVLAHDGDEAVAIWRLKNSDAVVLDNLLPNREALQAAEQIGTSDPDVPVILYAGFDDTYLGDDRLRFVTACVEKSGNPAELKAAIRRAFFSEDHGRRMHVGLPPM